MSTPPRPNDRLLAIIATTLVIAAPVVLIIMTLSPLESAPRSGRAAVVEGVDPGSEQSVDDTEPDRNRRRGNRRNRRNRDQNPVEPTRSALATPMP